MATSTMAAPAHWFGSSRSPRSRKFQRSQCHRPIGLEQPALKANDVVAVARHRRLLGALEREVVEERLVHFAEPRGGVCGLVHPRLQVCLG